MWFALYAVLGIIALGLYTKKGKNAVKLAQVFIETLQSNAKNNKINIEYESINMAYTIKYGDLHINAINSFYHYDALCFTSNSFSSKETHNHNLTNEIRERIPLFLVRSGVCIGAIPFRPSDYNHNRLYVAIKRISQENYSIYGFENNEYINMLDLMNKFEKDLILNIQKETTLAEAYD